MFRSRFSSNCRTGYLSNRGVPFPPSSRTMSHACGMVISWFLLSYNFFCLFSSASPLFWSPPVLSFPLQFARIYYAYVPLPEFFSFYYTQFSQPLTNASPYLIFYCRVFARHRQVLPFGLPVSKVSFPRNHHFLMQYLDPSFRFVYFDPIRLEERPLNLSLKWVFSV